MPTVKDPYGLVGTKVRQRYSVDSFVGVGRFSAVYRGTKLDTKSPVALKFLKVRRDLPGTQRPLLVHRLTEASAIVGDIARHSPRFCEIQEVAAVNAADGRWLPLMVQTWLDGASLESIIAGERAREDAPRSLHQAMELLAPVADSLAYAHARGVVHGGLSPRSLYVRENGGGDEWCVVEVLDLGVVAMLEAAQTQDRAFFDLDADVTCFVPTYAAPEQFSEQYGQVGPWTDVFALALILVELVTGVPALGEGTDKQLEARSTSRTQRPTPRVFWRDVGLYVENVLERALAVNPHERYATVSSFWDALRAATRMSPKRSASSHGVEDAEIASLRPQAATSEPYMEVPDSDYEADMAFTASDPPSYDEPKPVHFAPAPAATNPRISPVPRRAEKKVLQERPTTPDRREAREPAERPSDTQRSKKPVTENTVNNATASRSSFSDDTTPSPSTRPSYVPNAKARVSKAPRSRPSMPKFLRSSGALTIARIAKISAATVVVAGGGVALVEMMNVLSTPPLTGGRMIHAAAEAPVVPAAKPAPVVAAPKTCPQGMIQIPGGHFFMGSDDDTTTERPAHPVTLSTYCIDATEVTAARYKKCSDDGLCKRAPKGNDWPGIEAKDHKTYDALCNRDGDKGQHPMNCVDWSLAGGFCAAQGARLPTEAEWEFAARGRDGRKYAWGDDAPTSKRLNACGKECVAWGRAHGIKLEATFDGDDGFATTAPVGSFLGSDSRWGVHDMAGNVAEWTADYYGEYLGDAQTDPQGPQKGAERALRGGSWNGSNASTLRSTFRTHAVPEARTFGIGFRCAKTL